MITFAQIEQWRTERKLPKRRMAEVLGVTNSTYHNWARGKAVPTVNAQRKLLAALSGDTKTPTPRPARAQPLPVSEGSEALRAAASIVNTYLETHPGKLEPAQFTQLVRDVLEAVS
ncbi:MAG: helix-turn-helix transcriptional regulator [Planctomycetes bacterium]|nr:helix-turn-helix transcriptional regulator [Planctomycetota bacterium]